MQLARIEPGYDQPAGHSEENLKNISHFNHYARTLKILCNLPRLSRCPLSMWQLLAGLQSSDFGLRESSVSGLWSLVPGHSHYRCMRREVTPPHGCVRSSLFLVRAKIQQLQKLKLLPLAVVATHRNIERKLSDMKIVKTK
ncbi:LOW QUALITY PROTEIN: uncharacterized protein LOC108103096 [Drosophila eugracilis]|uniref:LOW QUALITY PROTEIN: uncharacterized protein LOC108103096 n=1 Tax=Drosophila eugracilis TaxID=29029 RepID=UPI0007E70AF0|nr:LOW QUALITY PROTEIN: uncharacterized protein LOC108103096 [Drosophila eugracilis]